MPDKNLTNNEIIKALEYCKRPIGEHDCQNCSYVLSKGSCTINLFNDILDLINRQKAKLDEAEDTIQFADKELKKANAEIERLADSLRLYRNYNPAIRHASAEAVKEFAERLTDKAELIRVNAFESKWAISQDDIDNLLKEMVGNSNGS